MNVSIGQDDSKLLYDVIVNATATNDMSGSAAGPSYAVPNISIACTPAYGEPLLNATTVSLWWADEPYWEASEPHVLCPETDSLLGQCLQQQRHLAPIMPQSSSVKCTEMSQTITRTHLYC